MIKFKTMGTIIDDWNVEIKKGFNSGKKLKDLSEKDINWMFSNVYYGDMFHVINRIKNRTPVTKLIETESTPDFIPQLTEDTNTLPSIKCPENIDKTLFGTFIEYFVKFNLNIQNFNDVKSYLAKFGLAQSPGNLNNYDMLEPTHREINIEKSYRKEIYDVTDLCNLSFVQSLLAGKIEDKEFAKLYEYVAQNKDYFETYITELKSLPEIPKINLDVQSKYNDITVGCVTGNVDAIYTCHTHYRPDGTTIDTNQAIYNNCIIDIKCFVNDDIDYHRKKLYAYACMYKIRHNKYIEYCKIFDFISGKIYVMNISNINISKARTYILNLGKKCSPSHEILFKTTD